MPQKFIYVLQTPFTLRDYKRHGMDIMVKNGIEVVVIDASRVIYPKIVFNDSRLKSHDNIELATCSDILAFRRELSRHVDADLIINLTQSGILTRSNLSIMRAISLSTLPYMIWIGPIFPGWRDNVTRNRVNRSLRNLVSLIHKKDYLSSIIAKLPIQWLGVRHANFALTSEPLQQRPNSFIGPETRIIQGNHPDFSLYLDYLDEDHQEKDQAVFIDQNLPFHHDLQHTRTKGIEPEPYYEALERFFKHVERTLGLKVVVALHPRADKEQIQGYFPGRKLVHHATHRLVLESRLVLAHSSTTISMAIMAYKPLIIITTDGLWKLGVERMFEQAISNAAGVPLIFADGILPDDMAPVMTIDRECYDDYLATYIRNPSTARLPTWRIGLDAFRESFGECNPAPARSVITSEAAT
jgi:hypothetical protein